MTERARPTAPRGTLSLAAAALPVLLLLGGCAGRVAASSTPGRSFNLVLSLVTAGIALFLISVAERMIGEALSIAARLIVAFLLMCTVVVALFGLSVFTVYDVSAKLMILLGATH